MGSPISNILAKIVLYHLLKKIIPKLPYSLPFIYKYVDDIFCAIPNNHEELTLKIFNSANNHVQFTIETETEQCVPFLGTKVIRLDNGDIILDGYLKIILRTRNTILLLL
ncbi:hypothetical protein WA026_018545 [Henosepilachna vigintioctopunctata]|uniref:Reverse transcriptase domain-containing protein n=1 Tax=Henosepilachna vigintioctopunctata TaxID=420089 RepID=A0AAW1U4N9_9CUCU